MPVLPTETLWLAAGLLGLLTLASAIGALLARRMSPGDTTYANLNQRTRAWWVMVALFLAAAAAGRPGITLLFLVVSLVALREMLSLSPTRPADRRTVRWAFFVVTPLQYALVYFGWYGLFAIFVPVWVFLFVALRCALGQDALHYHERVAKIQWALMVCVYFISHVPALLDLRIPAFEGRHLSLVLFLALVVQLSDVLQYVWGKLLGKHQLVPRLSPGKTWEGLLGGGLTAAAVGMGLWWMTPFSPAAALGMSLAIVTAGFFGGLVMSAVKRDAGVKDWSDLIPGHGGLLDRVDSLCFAAPVFFHLVRYAYGE